MYRRVSALLFAAGWGANHFTTLLVVYRRELALSPSSLGLLFGAYALGLVPGLVFAGRASDDRGRRALVLPASVLAIVGSTILGFGSHGFGVLLAGRLVYGLGMGAIMSPGSVWVQELSPPELGPLRATLALSAGFGIGPLLSGVIAEFAPAPMVLPYVAHGVVMATALAGALVVPETAPLGDSAERSARDERRLRARDLAVLAELSPAAPWAFGFAAISMAILPGILRPHVARPVLYSGFVILTTLACGVAMQPLTRRVGRLGNRIGLLVGAAGIFVGASAVRALSPSLVLAAAALTGCGYGLVMTTGLREAAQRARTATRGAIVGIYYVLTYVGFALPFLHATIAKKVGDVAALQGACVAALVCLVVRVVIEARRGDRRPEPNAVELGANDSASRASRPERAK
jgi:MFS family permease